MALRFEPADFESLQLRALLEEHRAEMYRISPPESVHTLDWNKLQAPDLSFWSVHDDERLIGCGALRELAPDVGELKSMRIDETLRGRGLGMKLLAFLEGQAKTRGYRCLYLETGPERFFEPARLLYEKAGFVPCGPFGDYRVDRHSVFMRKDYR